MAKTKRDLAFQRDAANKALHVTANGTTHTLHIERLDGDTQWEALFYGLEKRIKASVNPINTLEKIGVNNWPGRKKKPSTPPTVSAMATEMEISLEEAQKLWDRMDPGQRRRVQRDPHIVARLARENDSDPLADVVQEIMNKEAAEEPPPETALSESRRLLE